MERQNWNALLSEDEDGVTWSGAPDHGLGDTMWKYEQLRAGRVYTRFMFNTREEAEGFAEQMAKAQPDLFGRIEPVHASAVWN